MIRLKHIICALLAMISLTSCIRDEISDCPAMDVRLAVKDKNFFNIHDFPVLQPKDENLPFREYVSSVYYRLTDPETGSVMEERGPIVVTGDEKEFQLPICPCLPHGTYDVTVWGGLQDYKRLNDAADRLPMHKDRHEGDDVYVAQGVLEYTPYSGTQTLYMERVKGELLILVENLPVDGDKLTASIDGLQGIVTRKLEYSEKSGADFSRTQQGAVSMAAEVMLAPTKARSSGILKAVFDGADGTRFTPKDVHLTIKRNELTIVKYVYDPLNGDFAIYLFIDGQWEAYHDMTIEDYK